MSGGGGDGGGGRKKSSTTMTKRLSFKIELGCCRRRRRYRFLKEFSSFFLVLRLLFHFFSQFISFQVFNQQGGEMKENKRQTNKQEID